MNKVLVTGGAGFIGYHLSKRLADKGDKVHILDNLSRSHMDDELQKLVEKENVSFLQRDVTIPKTWDELETEYYDIVYHFAAMNGTENFYTRPTEVLKIGCLSTIYLLEWASKQKNKPKLVYSSSSEVYAATAKILGSEFPIPTPETISPSIEDVKNVRWSYAGGKLIGEIAFYCYAKTHDINDFNIIRFHNIYGPRMGYKHVISEFIDRHLRQEKPFFVYGGDNTRTFCFINDALDALEKIVESPQTVGEIIHIGNDEKDEIKIKKLAEMIFEVNNEKVEISILPAPEGSVARRCADIKKLKNIGYKKTVNLQQGLKLTYEWYKNNAQKRRSS